jgi:hypothetical protein
MKTARICPLWSLQHSFLALVAIAPRRSLREFFEVMARSAPRKKAGNGIKA